VTDEQTESVETQAVAPAVVPAPLREVDSVLADVARRALAEVTPESSIGELLGARDIADDVVNVEFATTLGGYIGWHWTVTIATLEGGEPNVLELELLPFEGALLAPAWVPWADRLADYRSTHPDGVPIDDLDDESDDDDLDDDESDDDADDADHDDFDDLDVDALDDGLDLDDDVLEEAIADADEVPAADETAEPAPEHPADPQPEA
jgi:Protein of unknown function (DUF3027)